jgi:uncharacterized membrane protein
VWIISLLGLGWFSVWNILVNPHDTPLCNGIRAVAYAILAWCILQICLYGYRLRRTKLSAMPHDFGR